MKQVVKRNMAVFEAPIELTEKAKQFADTKMISTSAIYRQAVSQFLSNNEMYYKSDMAEKI